MDGFVFPDNLNSSSPFPSLPATKAASPITNDIFQHPYVQSLQMQLNQANYQVKTLMRQQEDLQADVRKLTAAVLDMRNSTIGLVPRLEVDMYVLSHSNRPS